MKTGCLMIFLLLLCLAGGVADAETKQCAGLINRRCQECHYKTRICQALGKKTKAEWKSTVKNMIRQGAKLYEAEIGAIIDCLGSAPVGADFVCKN